jgi:uncharacterized protein with HEPN domain
MPLGVIAYGLTEELQSRGLETWFMRRQRRQIEAITESMRRMPNQYDSNIKWDRLKTKRDRLVDDYERRARDRLYG